MTTVPCFGKLNLTLRLTGVLPSGYHELCSLFCRIGPIDTLTINPSMADNVRVIFKRAKSANLDRNILFKAIETARAERADVPFLDMTLEKNVPPGTGLGCGSGDAAALLSYLAARYRATQVASRVGADVPFLCSPSPLALAQGTGDLVTPLERNLSALHALVIIPEWRCQTPEMYQKVDRFYRDVWPKNATEAREETAILLDRLCAGEPCRLLPNDFVPVLLEEYPRYQELFGLFERESAVAWGVSGSGSAAFALWHGSVPPIRLDLSWIEDVLNFSLER